VAAASGRESAAPPRDILAVIRESAASQTLENL
jgi:hypothetical protein